MEQKSKSRKQQTLSGHHTTYALREGRAETKLQLQLIIQRHSKHTSEKTSSILLVWGIEFLIIYFDFYATLKCKIFQEKRLLLESRHFVKNRNFF